MQEQSRAEVLLFQSPYCAVAAKAFAKGELRLVCVSRSVSSIAGPKAIFTAIFDLGEPKPLWIQPQIVLSDETKAQTSPFTPPWAFVDCTKDVTKQNMKVVWEDVSESLKIPYLENTCPLVRGAKLVRPLTEDGAAPPAIRKMLDKVKKRKQEAEGGEREAKKPRE